MLAKRTHGLRKQPRQIDSRVLQEGLLSYIPDATPGSGSFRNPQLPEEYTKISHCPALLPILFPSHVRDKALDPWPDGALSRMFTPHQHEGFMIISTNVG